MDWLLPLPLPLWMDLQPEVSTWNVYAAHVPGHWLMQAEMKMMALKTAGALC